MKYPDLHMSVLYNCFKTNYICNEVNGCCFCSALNVDCSVHAPEVSAASDKLKPNKSDSSFGLSSNHILSAGND
jgi:hypothetical protein